MLTTIGLCGVGLVVIYIIELIRRWRKSKCKNGVLLPPGSMGLPFIGETLHLLIPSYSLDIHPFLKTRFERYGPIFRTSIAGRPVVISADQEVNQYILRQEGNLVELWYLDSFSNLLFGSKKTQLNLLGDLHKYIRKTFLRQFGTEILKQKLLALIEDTVNKTLNAWSSQDAVEVKQALSVMLLNFNAKKLFSYDAEKSSESLGKIYSRIVDGLFSFPLNIPGTTHHKCVKDKAKVITMLRDELKQRRTGMACEEQKGDTLDQLNIDMDTQEFISEDFIVYFIFGSLFASSETISGAISFLLTLLSDHPSVLHDLTAEHEAIFSNRENPNSTLTWDEYKSMTFTQQVVNETLRLINASPGLLRRAVKDIPIKGFIIPAGWTIMLATATHHLSSDPFNDPLEFNPWRWKDLDSEVLSKSFMPFGQGIRQCPGAEFTRAFMATFLHVLVTKYRWTKIKGGKITRSPILGFGRQGIHINFSRNRI